MRLAALALALAALALSGCETTAEKSAKLEHQAKLAAQRERKESETVTFGRESKVARVLAAQLLKGSESSAAVVTVRNDSARALRAVPVALTVRQASGTELFKNDEAGSEAALVSIPSIPPHGVVTWVDDQVPQGGASVSAQVGEAQSVSGAMPAISLSGVHLTEDETSGPGAGGTVANHSAVAQQKLVVYVLARRGGRVVAAGRAVIAELGAGSSQSFQVFFVGDPHGAQLQASAPPSSF